MSAEVELLRHAAFHMRDRAFAATPGPWLARRSGVVGVEQPAEIGGHMLFESWQCDDGNHADKRREDAEHIASWHPSVALAVADWLEHCAEVTENKEVSFGLRVAINSHALIVARAYLAQRKGDLGGTARQDSGLCPGCRHESEHRYDVGCVARKDGRRCGCRYDARACPEVPDAS